MPELIPCYICGVVPEIQRSYSSRLISHRCRDFHSMWGSKSQVIAEWNDSNSQKSGSVKTPNNSDYEAALLNGLADELVSTGISLIELGSVMSIIRKRLHSGRVFNGPGRLRYTKQRSQEQEKNMKWKFKEDARPQGGSDGFWYDITDGGYIDPSKVLADKQQLDELLKAVTLVKSFEDSMTENELINEF